MEPFKARSLSEFRGVNIKTDSSVPYRQHLSRLKLLYGVESIVCLSVCIDNTAATVMSQPELKRVTSTILRTVC